MRIMVIGCDGYIGYPLSQRLLSRGHEVVGVDCFHRRRIISERDLESMIPIECWSRRRAALQEIGNFDFKAIDIAEDYKRLFDLFKEFDPEGIINLAQQPSPAYSMIGPKEASFTIKNNVLGLMNIYWAMRDYNPESHVVTLGTMGEYGTPNLPIPEGFFEVEYKGMKDVMPFPRQTNSIYHTSKIQNTDLAWFACRIWELRTTDIHQGVVYGTRTEEMKDDPRRRTRYDVGECFGTMINRAVACAVMGHPVTLYGTGMQQRGYIALRDSIQCLALAVEQPPTDDDSIRGHRVVNQFDECYSCQQIAEEVQRVGNEEFDLAVDIKHIENPRIEKEVHYYNPAHDKIYKLGFKPTQPLEEELKVMIEDLIPQRPLLEIYKHRIIPKIRWRPKEKGEKRK